MHASAAGPVAADERDHRSSKRTAQRGELLRLVPIEKVRCDSRFATGAVTYVGCDVKLVAKEEELARRVPSLKLHMTHRSAVAGATGKGSFFLDSTEKDVVRIDMMHKRVTLSGSSAAQQGLTPWRALSERLVATVGVRGGRVRGYAAEPVSDDHAHRRRPQLAAVRALFVYGR
ncbi:hypothetical protein ZWY2020_042337 [Hordeum vulgare]|nr:hypothetical protein ZWY2020_042337 [Hordeum vulgare]